MRIRPWLKWLAGLVLVLTLAGAGLHFLFRPWVMERAEIFRGVFLTVEKLPRSGHGGGRMMVVEVHWDTPGVRLHNRQWDTTADPSNPDQPHYRLANADWALATQQASILVNTVGYAPEAFYRSFPGMPVRNGETLVSDGQASHIHEHSYLLYWDERMDAHLLNRKPPDPEIIKRMRLGIGVQGIPISDGKIRPQAMDHKDLVMARTFIGVDPQRRILWLVAFEKASGFLMLEKAQDLGIVYGGMLDSGNATHLLVGRGARGVLPHSGIRHWRPLGAWLAVYAESLDP